METHANEARYQPLLIGAAAVILLGTFGIAAVMAWVPRPTDVAAAHIPDQPRALPAGLAGAETRIPLARAEGGAPATVKCGECGIVESTREIEQPGDGTGPGAAGSVTRGDRNEVTGDSTKTYEVTVRMKDGSRHVFMDAKRANWRPGARVIIIEGASQSSD